MLAQSDIMILKTIPNVVFYLLILVSFLWPVSHCIQLPPSLVCFALIPLKTKNIF